MNRLVTLARQLRRAPAEEAPSEPGFERIDAAEGEIVRLRLRRPIVAGMAVVLVLVFGLFLWAAIFRISGAVNAQGTVKVENNSKVLKSREGGVIRRILVREGQAVRAGQLLIQLNPVQAQASVEIYRAAYDTALANAARFQAESAAAAEVAFPPELLRRQAEPAVGQLLASQRTLFQTRMLLYRSQSSVLSQQAAQLSSQIAGLRAQVAAMDAQSGLVDEELSGVRDLNRLGYAPKTRLLALQRSAVGIKGQRGQLMADIARAAQGIGEVRLQIAQLEDRRLTDAATGLREAQDKLTDAGPKLRATEDTLAQTQVRAPVAGNVFNLTQYTEGGVAGPGETLLQVVPSGTPLLITAKVAPHDITSVRVGLPVLVTLTAYNPRTTPQIEGRVSLVAADATQDEMGREPPHYVVQVKIDPAQLAKAGPNVRLSPGMPAQVSIITGSRTILDYLLGPMTESMRTALAER